MSVENAKVLIEKCKADERLAERFREAGPGGFEQLAQELGLGCTQADLTAALSKADELSDKDLERISGGIWGMETSYGGENGE